MRVCGPDALLAKPMIRGDRSAGRLGSIPAHSVHMNGQLEEDAQCPGSGSEWGHEVEEKLSPYMLKKPRALKKIN